MSDSGPSQPDAGAIPLEAAAPPVPHNLHPNPAARPFLCAGHADVEEAVASRLYRAELARAEAQAKLSEW